MCVHCVETPIWWLQEKILMSYYIHFVFDTELKLLNMILGEYLASEMKVTSDVEKWSGKSHWWTPSSHREQSSTLAVPDSEVALSEPKTVNILPGSAVPNVRAPGAPTWAFNRLRGRPHTCDDILWHLEAVPPRTMPAPVPFIQPEE
jgi:hypothetical protein